MLDLVGLEILIDDGDLTGQLGDGHRGIAAATATTPGDRGTDGAVLS
jgi:hypothetical protein